MCSRENIAYTNSVKEVRRFEVKKLLYLLAYVLLVSLIGYGIYRNLNKLPGVLSKATRAPEAIQNQVTLTKVVDGDTIKVLIGGTEQSVRLIGINAPESADCRGDWSRTELEKLLENQTVLLEDDSTQGDKDKYDRLLRYIHTGTGLNVNGKMVELGAAKEYTYDKNYKYKDLYVSAQNIAKQNNLGVWGVPCE
ncbi:MAG: Nuclease (SNase domain protein) [candidate division WWE3 bacterium GW2011_GWF2_41_45]|uniref:Nuclease (SNase domain protein) n=1 Tax=candidate division WWE3 bacterium GW2011_GWC2_41_23 TaxID=1619123 RepID=A0A0G0VQH5_UNCKA|nr:MAG: Nuclease (SNase domain protein) [candidate division WWE3 bacterium GW2011_GWC2_41_23]KKS10294.1 MAG: Nuclease (SNase domain protein) [candidate division WWE3 bacterium GW2011_GWF2_41_45]KKS12261.1 MAG: Nuclease (SNase domain protein) [candidate division WWE3 bacterium GW2011_GWF1_41_53]KKS20036.1 MAG: Nuclease (SNase domain protein) [candidate division WWE3 bacterium GW2011_GWE1_41_72]KKS28447.1 MAG: Nuclease (SNase domain protein) [candidate division WWE3 bacterium GW2011_GWC1_42_102]